MRLNIISALMVSFTLVTAIQSCLNIDERDRDGRYDDSGEFPPEFPEKYPEDTSRSCPVMMLEVPDAASNMEPLSVRGLGFVEGQRLFLQDGGGLRTELEWELGPAGVICTVPPSLSVGKYSLILLDGTTGKDWVLSECIEIAIRMDLTAIRYIDATTYGIDDVPSAAFADTASKYGMSVEEFREFLVSMGYSDSRSTTGYRIERDGNGYVTRMAAINDDSSHDAFTFTWNGNHDEVKAVNNTFESGYDMVLSYSWRLDDGRAVEMTEETEKRESSYVLVYDGYGSLTSQQTHSGFEYNAFGYDGNHCYTGLKDNVLFTYNENSIKIQASPVNVPVAIQDGLYHFSFSSPDADWLPVLNMAGLCGKGSSMVPTRLFDPATRKYFDITYDVDGYGYVHSASWKTEGMDGFFGFIPVTTSTTIHFEYNGE